MFSGSEFSDSEFSGGVSFGGGPTAVDRHHAVRGRCGGAGRDRRTGYGGCPADLQACLQETGDYVTRGKAVLYVIGLANTCEARLRCEIYANVTGARGSALGHAVMMLGAASSGAAAKQTYAMRVKAAGGTAQVSRDCKAL